MRGEYKLKCKNSMRNTELPPRARRILAVLPSHLNNDGTTSACAENTLPAEMSLDALRNYLRVRGEYTLAERIAPARAELPPRARRILFAAFL